MFEILPRVKFPSEVFICPRCPDTRPLLRNSAENCVSSLPNRSPWPLVERDTVLKEGAGRQYSPAVGSLSCPCVNWPRFLSRDLQSGMRGTVLRRTRKARNRLKRSLRHKDKRKRKGHTTGKRKTRRTTVKHGQTKASFFYSIVEKYREGQNTFKNTCPFFPFFSI